MTPSPTARPAPSEARERLLRVASELFYRDGITGVGVDKVLAEAGVTRATMYRHFRGKEALVVAYLEGEDAALRATFAAAAEGDPAPGELLERVVTGIADDITRGHTRGCPFINASAEYPDRHSLVRKLVKKHRAWFRGTLEELVAAAGRPDPEALAASLVLLRDAALVGGYLDGAEVARPAFEATARDLLGLGAA